MNDFVAGLIPALGHSVLHFLWQGTLIGVFAMLALYGLRHARPQARYAVACVALFACVLVPVLTTVAQFTATTMPAASAAPRGLLLPISAGSDASAGQGALAIAATGHSTTVSNWIVALWAAGTGAMFLRLALGLAWVQHLRRTPQDALQVTWQIRLDALAVRFGLRRGVLLRLVDTLDSPVSAGWWRPVVLFPTALLARMPIELIEALLAHELAHIRRHDYLVNLLQNVAEALLFYHPATWWLSNRIRVERELIADGIAAGVICTPRHLALALSELSEIQHTCPTLRLAQSANDGDLLSRIQQLVRPVKHAHCRARLVFPLLGLAAVCIASYAFASIPRSSGPAPTADVVRPTPASHSPDAPMRTTFALVPKTGDAPSIWGPSDDPAAIEAARRSVHGDFLWVRRAGVDYVITDDSLLAQARQAWQETNALSRQIDLLNAAMAIRHDKVRILRDRVEMLSAPVEPSSDELQARSDWDGVISQQQVEVTRQKALEKAWHSLASESDRATAPMETLSQQIELLSRRRENAAERTERELQNLVENALALRLAKRAPLRV
jgi:beta-lactamase regulating signal transducer with metallopeptidase domain